MAVIKKLFALQKNPRKGFFAFEWVIIIYLLVTLGYTIVCYHQLENPLSMIELRLRVLVMTAILWAAYRVAPCRFTEFLRVLPQMCLLGVWYPDTYEINRTLPNLDYIFAEADQWIFGMQPALEFARAFPSVIVSELMDMGYSMYFVVIACTALFYFIWRYGEFQRCVFIIMASFFTFYVVFDLLPVVGPTFYYKAVGLEQISKGVFPSLGDYFNTHQDCLPSPGYADGVFYNLVEAAKEAGERPTAAFPSSHVGIATVCLLLVLRTRCKPFIAIVSFIYVFLCMATVYIQAHYAVDAMAGLICGVAFYWLFLQMSKKFCNFAHYDK